MKLNRAAFNNAKRLIRTGHFVIDDRDAWSEHQPSTKEENDFIRTYGIEAYALWHLGIDETEENVEAKRRYKFPYGDFRDVHRCALLSAESRAGQYKHFDIEKAVAQLHELLDGTKHTRPPAARKTSARRRSTTAHRHA
jgi:hypothetical protein